MLATGVAIPSFEQLALLVPIVFVGTMNPQAGDLGMMVPLEQAVLARGARDEDRTGIFSRYSLSGDLATAAGTLAAAIPDALTSFGFSEIGALKAMFYLYAALGLLSAVFYQALPAGQREETRGQAALGRSRCIVYKLTALFSLDAFGGGFAVQSLVALWLFRRFGVSLSTVSIFYFCTSILNAFSYLVAVWIAKRVGLVNTMVFTHRRLNLIEEQLAELDYAKAAGFVINGLKREQLIAMNIRHRGHTCFSARASCGHDTHSFTVACPLPDHASQQIARSIGGAGGELLASKPGIVRRIVRHVRVTPSAGGRDIARFLARPGGSLRSAG